MTVLSWCSRRVGGLSLIALLLLCYWVTSRDLSENGLPLWRNKQLAPDLAIEQAEPVPSTLPKTTILFAYYSLLIHVLVVIFPIRACWATVDITYSLKRLAKIRKVKESKRRRSSASSSEFSVPETLTPTSARSIGSSASISSASSEAGDMDFGYLGDIEIETPKNVHAILIPNYKEELHVLEETLNVLASHPLARAEYDIYLAMEARESGSEAKALTIISDYVKKFRFIGFTSHPGDVPNEAPGKSSNIAWAAREASERYPLKTRANVTVTVIDADSQLSSSYFEQINTMRATFPETAPDTLYAAPIIFDRNAHLVPAVVRVADILWGAAGMSGLHAGSSIRPPTSVYSLPLTLADRVGGWDTDSESIGEDLHMYLKCFFALNGRLCSRTILSPVSSTNVSSSMKGLRGSVDGVRARYKQAMRHMWGALDSGYALREVVSVFRNRGVTERTRSPIHNVPLPHLDSPTSNLDPSTDGGIYSDLTTYALPSPSWLRILALFHRLFEAHFLPTHMAILTIFTGLHTLLIPSATTSPNALTWTFTVSASLRLAGFLLVALYMFLYESFHALCVEERRKEMVAAGLGVDTGISLGTPISVSVAHSEKAGRSSILEDLEKQDLVSMTKEQASMMTNSSNMNMEIDGISRRDWRTNWSDYVLIPLVAPLFGSIPAAQAQFAHFWTLDLVYAVSQKPERKKIGGAKVRGEVGAGRDGRNGIRGKEDGEV